MTLGQQIKAARKQKGFTQLELAQKLGVAQHTVHYWEINRSSPRSKHMKDKLSAALTTKKEQGMTTIAMTFNENELDAIFLKRLKETYMDHVTHYMWEVDAAAFRDALLMVINHFSVPSEYDAWYETIKEL